MLSIKKLFFIVAMSFCVVSCDSSSTSISSSTSSSVSSSGPIENDSDLPTEIQYLDEPCIQIHYQRTKGSYKIWGLWLWADGKDGAEYQFNYADDYGVIAYYPLSQFGNPRSLGFIVKELFSSAGDGVWNKDGSNDRFMDIDMLQIDAHQSYHVYLISGRSAVFTDMERTKTMNAVTSCQFEKDNRITIQVNNLLSSVVIKENGKEVPILKTIDESQGLKKIITLENEPDAGSSYTADITFKDGAFVTKNISIRNLYNETFDSKYNYDGELGAIYSKENTEFKVWSPVSQSIKLRIYDSGTPKVISESGSDEYKEYDMVKDDKGVFSYKVDGDLEGKYYTYVVTNGNNLNGTEIVDPYAKSAGINGSRGMIVDFDKTNPDGWDEIDYLKYDRKELTVYETHVADVTSSASWTGNEENRKKFKGMFEEGTTYTKGETTVATGFDHIKELGVNAVQIIPIFDQANDEVNPSFNWGYNPLNYNCLEGSYSSNPYNGYSRIKEFKQLVQAYNKVGITIIMDVVYNHVAGLKGSNFDVLMPSYYFRYTSSGDASNGSGCGNETASDKYMFKKFMIDSIAFWTKEYKLGGYRFDLMGIHDIETMNQVTEKAKEINPYICIYGEPWAGGTTALPTGFTAAIQANANYFKGYGQFNDQMRDAMVKSGLNEVSAKGWVTQTKFSNDPNPILSGIKGETDGATTDPDKTVNYVTCHDNYTLHDRCIVAGISDEDMIEKMSLLAHSIVFGSQGTTFMLAGEELLRTKIVYDEQGNPTFAKDSAGKQLDRYEVSGNSYCSSYKTNEIDYSRKITHSKLFNSFKEFIKNKQQFDGLHYGGKDLGSHSVSAESGNSVLVSKINGKTETYTYYFANGVCDGTYEIDVGTGECLSTLRGNISQQKVSIQPFETIILKTQK